MRQEEDLAFYPESFKASLYRLYLGEASIERVQSEHRSCNMLFLYNLQWSAKIIDFKNFKITVLNCDRGLKVCLKLLSFLHICRSATNKG